MFCGKFILQDFFFLCFFFLLQFKKNVEATSLTPTFIIEPIFMSRKKRFNTKYSPEFKLSVIMDMRENRLSYSETARKYGLVKNSMGGAMETLHRWERIYLEEGAAGFMTERRGRKSTGRPRKQPLDKSVEEDLIAENQRLKERIQYLEAENEYIKKLSALVYAEEQKSGKKRK